MDQSVSKSLRGVTLDEAKLASETAAHVHFGSRTDSVVLLA